MLTAAAAQAYDIVEPSSFAKAKFWVNELQQHGAPLRCPAPGGGRPLAHDGREIRIAR